MPRHVVGGLIQTASPITDPALPIDTIRKASIDAHIPLIEEAGRLGVQILGLQEISINFQLPTSNSQEAQIRTIRAMKWRPFSSPGVHPAVSTHVSWEFGSWSLGVAPPPGNKQATP